MKSAEERMSCAVSDKRKKRKKNDAHKMNYCIYSERKKNNEGKKRNNADIIIRESRSERKGKEKTGLRAIGHWTIGH